MNSDKNPFKELSDSLPPSELKEKVMHSVEMSQLILDVADLFVVKMGKTVSQLFKTNPNDQDYGASQ